MEIEFRIDVVPDVQEIVRAYRSSSLNRPVDDVERIQKMYNNSNLVVTAWDGEMLFAVVVGTKCDGILFEGWVYGSREWV